MNRGDYQFQVCLVAGRRVLAPRDCSICSIVQSRVSFTLITILAMINPLLQFNLQFFASGSFLVGNTPLVQAHTTLDRAFRFHRLPKCYHLARRESDRDARKRT